MKGNCCKCSCQYEMSAEEEDLCLTGFLECQICDECFEDEESSFGHYPDYPEFSDADPGL